MHTKIVFKVCQQYFLFAQEFQSYGSKFSPFFRITTEILTGQKNYVSSAQKQFSSLSTGV